MINPKKIEWIKQPDENMYYDMYYGFIGGNNVFDIKKINRKYTLISGIVKAGNETSTDLKIIKNRAQTIFDNFVNSLIE